MNARIVTAFVLLATFCIAQQSSKAGSKPDFFTYHSDGTVKIRGVYEVDTAGRVTKFTVFDGGTKLKYTEVPFYAPDGRLIRADRYDADHKLSQVVVYFDTFLKVLDKDGSIVDTQGFSNK